MKDRFFTKLDWAAFWTATIATFAVYFHTLGPSVGLEDSGELATAAANLGVPHPPGYPFWTFCSWLFCKAFGWVTYMGHPSPAWCVSLCSAVFGAFAAGCTAMLICRSSRDFIGEAAGDSDERSPVFGLCPQSILSFGGGVAGAMTFALSPVEWSQSTIVEIYSLNALFLMWVFLLSYRWMRKPTDKMLFFTAFVFGLGLTNYQVLLFAIVPLALIILMKDAGFFRDVFIFLCPIGLLWQLLKIGSLDRADVNMSKDVINKHLPVLGSAKELVTTPSSIAIAIGIVLIVGAIVAAVVLRRRGELEKARKALLGCGFAGAAIVFLSSFVFTTQTCWEGVTAAVAPLVAPTKYAAIAGFAAASVVAGALSALEEKRLNRYLVASAVLAAVAVALAAAVPQAGDLGFRGEAFPWGKSTVMFLVIVAALFAMCHFTPRGYSFAVPVAGVHIAAFLLLSRGAMNGLTHPCSWWFCWPIAWNFIVLALTWLALPHGGKVAGAAFFCQLGVSFYVYMPIVSDLRNPPMNWGYPRTWEGFKHAIMREQYEAIGFRIPKAEVIMNYFEDVRVQFTDLLIPFALVPFAAGHWIVKRENRKAFWQWMIPALVCFGLMSYLLIALANVKGDIQDGFIQKVKFISSHAMLALWIGYGLVFAAVAALWQLKDKAASLRRDVAYVLAALMIAVSIAYPLVDNYCGNYAFGVNEVAFKLGGSEQNGHTFGWQFGAYQLEGANAIREQLVEDEEPLPDPEYPPRMEDHAIFFGGTDPGRFVPTYMIYSANFRPDVYLITQNALADDTYMSVERDLYGDEIWIPSKEDSGLAFNIYVDEVQRGIRQPNGDLLIQNGRVQVTGALGVMEINGILTRMMFDHDREKHAFYVEESYVIPWMYEFLAPHGLIMKIEKDPYRIDQKRIDRDADFWDWYTRRLLSDPMYRRDFAGQKSFSKLRAAIAGCLGRQGRRGESAQAYREACLLYPISPEAVFRYAQESLLPYRRWDAAIDLMDMVDEKDPNNARTRNLRDYVEHTRQLLGLVQALEPRLRKNELSPNERLSLAGAYYSLGRFREAGTLAAPFAATLTDPGEVQLVARILMEAQDHAGAEKALQRLVGMTPRNPMAFIDLCRVQHRLGKEREAQQNFVIGYNLAAEQVYGVLQRDKELQDIAAPLFKQAQQSSRR